LSGLTRWLARTAARLFAHRRCSLRLLEDIPANEIPCERTPYQGGEDQSIRAAAAVGRVYGGKDNCSRDPSARDGADEAAADARALQCDIRRRYSSESWPPNRASIFEGYGLQIPDDKQRERQGLDYLARQAEHF
jgi:hypothetical protein